MYCVCDGDTSRATEVMCCVIDNSRETLWIVAWQCFLTVKAVRMVNAHACIDLVLVMLLCIPLLKCFVDVQAILVIIFINDRVCMRDRQVNKHGAKTDGESEQADDEPRPELFVPRLRVCA